MTDAEILDRAKGLSALVIGDICLDRWCTYDPALGEASLETGIPRVGVVKTEVTPGAGGTVANNLAALGVGRVAVLGAVGMDGFGHELAEALKGRGILSDFLIRSSSMQTFTYTKLINVTTGKEDLPRIDFISTVEIEKETERKLLDAILPAVDAFDMIAIADQAETARGGVVTEAVRNLLADLAPAYPDKVFLADSRARLTQFRNVAVKPNEHETAGACNELFGCADLAALRRALRAPWMMVTHGARGAVVVSDNGEQWVPTRPVEHPVDICGAGDSFCAGALVAYALTRSPVRAAEFGNRVASITIMKRGTGTANAAEVLGIP